MLDEEVEATRPSVTYYSFFCKHKNCLLSLLNPFTITLYSLIAKYFSKSNRSHNNENKQQSNKRDGKQNKQSKQNKPSNNKATTPLMRMFNTNNSSRDEFTLWCEQQVESFKNPYIDGKILSGRLYANTLYAHALSYSRPGRFEPQNFVSVLFRRFCRNIPVQKPMPSLKIMLMYTLSDFT